MGRSECAQETTQRETKGEQEVGSRALHLKQGRQVPRYAQASRSFQSRRSLASQETAEARIRNSKNKGLTALLAFSYVEMDR